MHYITWQTRKRKWLYVVLETAIPTFLALNKTHNRKSKVDWPAAESQGQLIHRFKEGLALACPIIAVIMPCVKKPQGTNQALSKRAGWKQLIWARYRISSHVLATAVNTGKYAKEAIETRSKRDKRVIRSQQEVGPSRTKGVFILRLISCGLL